MIAPKPRRGPATTIALALAMVCPSISPMQAQGAGSLPPTELTITSARLGEERKVTVAIPVVYDSTARLPVLVLLDADDRPQFEAAVANVRFLASRRAIRPMLIVGIPNGATRTRDLTPPLSDSAAPSAARALGATGGADRFADFIVDEVLPAVRAKYRTSPYTVLAGHSFGGLFVVHIAARRPGVFAAGIAMSPSLWWKDSTLIAPYADAIVRTSAPFRLFASSGGLEVIIDNATRRFATRIQSAAATRVAFQYRRYADDAHLLTPLTSLTDGLRFVFEPVSLAVGPLVTLVPEADSATIISAFDQTERAYAAGARAIGVDPSLPEPFARLTGLTTATGYRQPGAAIAILRRNVAAHSESAAAYDALGDVLATARDSVGARDAYRAAVAVATRAHDGILGGVAEKLRKLEGRPH